MRAGADLLKPRIALAAAASALAVSVLASGGADPLAVPLALGVLLAAGGACALNQVLERRLDGLMERTRSRPLPAGALTPAQALAAAAALLAAGLALIGLAVGPAGALLAAAAVLWYDGVYTALKRVTAFAAVPGALAGTVPPALGWLAAGRSWREPELAALCLFFFLWQVPHFWLLVPGQSCDLRRAGLPDPGRVLGCGGLGRLSAVWMAAAAAAALLLPSCGVVASPAASALLAAAALRLAWQALPLLGPVDEPERRRAFGRLNAFVGSVLALLACDPFLARLSF